MKTPRSPAILALLALLAARPAPAQHLNGRGSGFGGVAGFGGVVDEYGARRIETPTESARIPHNEKTPMHMVSVEAASTPRRFRLRPLPQDELRRAFGPYDFRNGTRLGGAAAPALCDIDGTRFSLVWPDGHKDGPFDAADATADLTLGGREFRLEWLPRHVGVTCELVKKSRIRAEFRLGAVTPGTMNALVALRAAFAERERQLIADTADIRIEGIPTVHNLSTGKTRDGTVHRSERDKELARDHAESAASRLLDKFAEEHLPLRFIADEPETHLSVRGLPAGKYLLCARLRVPENVLPPAIVAPNRRAASHPGASVLLVWWTIVDLPESAGSAELTLTPANATTWRDIFLAR